MPFNRSAVSRAPVLVAAALLLLGTACGRRGPLEPPPDASAPPAPAAEAPAPSTAPSGRALPADRRLRPDGTRRPQSSSATPTTLTTQQAAVVEDAPEDEVEEPIVVSPSPTPKKRTRPFLIPKESFVLDPLL